MTHGKRRVAISELVASLIMIAITLVAGAAVFGWVNTQAGLSASAVGLRAASDVNFLSEREVVVYSAKVDVTHATVWVYNSGSINPENMVNVLVYDTLSPSNTCTVDVSASQSILVQKVVPIEVVIPSTPAVCSSLTFQTTHSYAFIVVGRYGSSAQITVKF